MTPRDQIQEHAKTAAFKVRQALNEFSAATGMCATVDVEWMYVQCIASSRPDYLVQNVSIRFADEARA